MANIGPMAFAGVASLFAGDFFINLPALILSTNQSHGDL
jgi:hypothetical protein